jgi:hypothetical protein
MPRCDQQMMVRRSDIDASRLEWVAVGGSAGGQRADLPEQLRQHALPVPQMKDDAHSGGKLTRQVADQHYEGFHRAGGAAYHDNVPTFHAGLIGEQPFRMRIGGKE